MIHVGVIELRERLAHFLDRAVEGGDRVVIDRPGAEPAMLISLSDYQGLMETLHLRSSPANAAALDASIAQAEAGDTIEVAWNGQAYEPR